jgi:hypothetical protein
MRAESIGGLYAFVPGVLSISLPVGLCLSHTSPIKVGRFADREHALMAGQAL